MFIMCSTLLPMTLRRSGGQFVNGPGALFNRDCELYVLWLCSGDCTPEPVLLVGAPGPCEKKGAICKRQQSAATLERESAGRLYLARVPAHEREAGRESAPGRRLLGQLPVPKGGVSVHLPASPSLAKPRMV